MTAMKQTALPDQHVIIITERTDDAYLLRRFWTFTINDQNGDASPVCDFVSAAAALQCHDRLAASFLLTKCGRR
jgi:hypothetical protein